MIAYTLAHAVVIVPFRVGDAGRLQAARHVIPKIRETGFRVLVVEQARQRTQLPVDERDHLLVEDEGPFRRARLLNLGARAVPEADALFFHESDMMVPVETLVGCLDELSRHDAVSPYDGFVRLTEEETGAHLSSGRLPSHDDARIVGRGERWTIAGGVLAMTRSCHEAVGGWDENLVGWGGDDDVQGMKLRKLGMRCLELPRVAHHLYHGRAEWGDEDRERHARNVGTVDRVAEMDRDGLLAYVRGNDFSGRGLASPKFSRRYFHEAITGWFDFDDLYREAVGRVEHGGKFVEVGAFHGKSTAFMAVEIANAHKPIEFYVVDTWRDPEEETLHQLDAVRHRSFDLFLRHMAEGDVSDVVRPLRIDSVQAARIFDDGSLDFVFVDAAHDEVSVAADISAWWPKVKLGGLLAGHDYASWAPGVIAAVDRAFGGSFERRGNSWLKRKYD